jgi:hypothetical protein
MVLNFINTVACMFQLCYIIIYVLAVEVVTRFVPTAAELRGITIEINILKATVNFALEGSFLETCSIMFL